MRSEDKKKEGEDSWRGFVNLCTKLKTPEDFERFFDLFLTLEEKKIIEGRYLVVKALEEGKLSQREIAELHKVSISQITRGSNALKIIGAPLRDLLKKYL